MGTTSHLNALQRRALVAYLQTLWSAGTRRGSKRTAEAAVAREAIGRMRLLSSSLQGPGDGSLDVGSLHVTPANGISRQVIRCPHPFTP